MRHLLFSPLGILRRALQFFFAPRLVFLLGLLLIAAAAQAQTISRVYTVPTSTVGGSSTKVDLVVYVATAPTSNLTINLTSSTSAAEVPATMTIDSGDLYGIAAFNTTGVNAVTTATITATYGGSSGQCSLTINPATVDYVDGPGNLVGGSSGSVNVYLNGAAGPSGTVVKLSNTNTAASVPTQITITANGTSGTAAVTTTPVDSNTSGSITATTGSVSMSSSFTVEPATLSKLYLDGPLPQTGVSGAYIDIRLNGPAGPSGTTLNLSSACPTALSLPSTATIPSGGTDAYVYLTATAIGMNVLDFVTVQQGSGTPLTTPEFTVLSAVGSLWPQTGAGIGNNSFCDTQPNSGGTQWTYPVRSGTNPPVIGAAGALYFTDGSYLNVISSSGTFLWEIADQFRTTPAIGADGTVYATASNGTLRGGYLLAYDTQGRQKWGLDGSTTGGYYPISYLSPSIGIDGTIYVLAESTTGDALLAVNPNKTIKWTCPLPAGYAEVANGSPVCSNDGSIYFVIRYSTTNGILMAVNSSGTEKWYYKVSNPSIASGLPVVVDAYSNVYVPTNSSDLVSLSTGGEVNWTYVDGSNTILSLGGEGNNVCFSDLGTTDNFVCVSESGTLQTTGAFSSGYVPVPGLDIWPAFPYVNTLVQSSGAYETFFVYDYTEPEGFYSGVTASPPISGAGGTIYQLLPGSVLARIR